MLKTMEGGGTTLAGASIPTQKHNMGPCILEAIDHLHASENILIEQLIVVTSRLDALVTHKNVLQPMGIRRSTAIKQPSQTKHTV